MSCHIFASNRVFGDTLLVAAHETENLKGSLIDLVSTIRNDTDYDFLPSISSPGFGSVTTAKEGDIFDDDGRRMRRRKG